MGSINYSDTGFMIFSTALVMLMTPGLALFYGGMVRKKNVLNTTAKSYIAIVLISLQFILIGYTLCFGKDMGGLIGGFQWLGLNGVGFAPNAYASNLPAQVFMLFELMFAVITPAIISGAVVERMNFIAFAIFAMAWNTLVYDPVAHWVWGTGGWLRNLGTLDFAGGCVIEISSGISALVAAIMLGRRRKLATITPHNIPLTILGAGILWFGWFGFNAGSAFGINSVALNSFITTNTAAAAAAASWAACELAERGRITCLGIATGIVVGLVNITPAAGYVSPMSSLVIGLAGGVLSFVAVTLATGIFASKALNSAGADGLLHGNPKQLLIQLAAIAATIAYSAVMTFVILKVLDKAVKLRVSVSEEREGLDLSIHGEKAYDGLSA